MAKPKNAAQMKVEMAVGRAHAPTQYELAHQAAQISAARPIAQGGLGLRLNNTAAERAEAMGLSVDSYHGTTAKPFPGFRSNYAEGQGTGVYSSTHASDTAEFSEGAGGQTIPLKVSNKLWNEGKDEPPATVEDTNRFYDDVEYRNKTLKDAGYHGVISPQANGLTGDEILMFDPKHTRSRFAAFDPDHAESSDMLKAQGGVVRMADGGILDGHPVFQTAQVPFAEYRHSIGMNHGGVNMAGGGRPPLRSLDEVPSDEYLKAELARINAAPTVRANSADETANYARYVAERAGQPIEMPARPDYTPGFSVLEKPTYGSEVPGTTPTIDQQRYELTMKGQQDAANKQYRAQQGDALAGMDPTGTLAVTDAARTMGLGMLALPVHAGRSAFHYLQHGNMKDAPTGMDYEEFMSPRTPEGAELVEEIGTAGSRLTGSEMAFGMNPTLWAYAPPTVAQMRAGLKLGAERAAPVLGKIDRAVRSGYDSGLIPQPGFSTKDVTPKVLAPATEQGFYSPTEAAGLNLKRQSGNGQAFLNDILKGENVRAEEVNAMGLDTFLKDKKNVTAAEVQDYIAKNKIELGEGVYSDKITEDPVGMAKRQEIFDAYNPAIRQAYADLNTSYDHPEIYARIERLSKERDEKADAAYKMPEPRGTQFDQYAIPGGENYREVVITLPQNKADSPDLAAATKKYEDAAEAHRLEGGMDNLLRMQDALYESQDLQTRINYESSHWQEPNVLAHVRLSDRVTDGKKTLLIDEVQSDWHQQARDARTYQVKYLINQGMSKEEAQKSVPKDYGYIKPKSKEDREKTKSMNAELDRLGDEYTRLGGFDPSDANKKENAEVRDRIQTLYNQLQSEEQADESGVPNAPYKDDWYQLALRRAIKEAVDGGFDRVALPTGEKVAKRFNVSDEKGMIKYYDEIYPTYLKKFGKKYGANVGSTTVDANGVPEPLHYMEITPAMRKEFSTGIHMAKGGKVSFASNVDAMRNELIKAK